MPLNELLEAGYTKTFVAKQLGRRAKTPSLQIQADRITALTPSKVERLYRRIQEGRVSVKEPKICQRKSYTANTPVARALSNLSTSTVGVSCPKPWPITASSILDCGASPPDSVRLPGS